MFTAAQIIWVIVLIACIVIEAVTVNLVSVWFAVGAVGAVIAAAFTPSVTVQIVVFGLVSAAALAVTRPLAKRIRQKRAVRTNADVNIGRKATVIRRVGPSMPGRVRLDGVDWQACSGEVLEEGAVCEVLDVDGATLLVKPAAEAREACETAGTAAL